MLPAEVKLLKPNPAGCWHWVPAMMHGLAVLCGPSTLFRNGVPAPGNSVSVTAEAAPVRVKVTAAVAAVPTNHCMFFMSRSLARRLAACIRLCLGAAVNGRFLDELDAFLDQGVP